MLRIGLKETPAGVEVNVDVELLLLLEDFHVSAVYPDNVTNLANNGTLLESTCVDNDHGEVEVFTFVVALSMERAIYDAQ